MRGGEWRREGVEEARGRQPRREEEERRLEGGAGGRWGGVSLVVDE